MRNLKAVLKPDILGGDVAELCKAVNDGKLISVFGCSEAEKICFSSILPKFIVYVVSDISDTERIKNSFYHYGRTPRILPEREDVLVLSKNVSSNSTFSRIGILNEILSGAIDTLIVTPESVSTYFPRPDKLKEFTHSFKVNEEYDLIKLATSLAQAGYVREESGGAGTFNVRGDILDIFSTDGNYYRLEFFGDTLESIKTLDKSNFAVIDKPTEIIVLPATDILIDDEVFDNALKLLKREKIDGETGVELYTRLTARDKSVSMGYAMPYIKSGLCTLADWLDTDSVFIFDDVKLIDNRINLLTRERETRIKALIEDKDATETQFSAFINKNTLYKEACVFPCVTFQQITSQNPVYDPNAVFSFRSVPIAKYYHDTDALVRDVRQWHTSGYRIAVCAGGADTARAVKDSFDALGIGARLADGKALPSDFEGTVIVEDGIEKGFVIHSAKLAVIGRDEIIQKKTAKLKVRKQELFTLPEVGDYVVHEFHGIGRCDGIVKLPQGAYERDYIEVSYKGGDKLYVPVESMDLLSRYSGGENAPKLSKMGGAEFERVKERVKASVKEMAVDLLSLYKERENAKGFKYSTDSPFQTEFENAFEFTPTEDQITAVAEIKNDMEKGKVMDRLLVGDVGYGKTEVALRAAFKTVLDGKQVALLAPTTILSEQHYNTAKKRFSDFGIRLACVNRYKTEKEIKTILETLADGKIDIICGTHRLLSDDVKFKDLGLLILDEEQRFGVEQKEKIKTLKSNVNVLSLSATPIPRTLHLSMNGIRDISVLETPPENRLPIETFVVAYSDNILKDAINREMMRGGQTFVLFNRVQGIEAFYAHVKELVPDARIIVAHGKLSGNELEERIATFYKCEADVLISTTIIENGIDLPSANTLIVTDADKLGLSSLYQLRGRVGRSNRMAYAYFTFRDDKVLSDAAYKRLSAIMDYTELGSGFKIAMRDLEIRGAGNVLGREQHGHMEKVGYDMYCKLLGEAVGELSGKSVKTYGEITVKSDIPAFVDEDYVVGNAERMRLYKRLAEISTVFERDTFISELTALYGAPKQNTVNLINTAYLKNMAVKKGVKDIIITDNSTSVDFYEQAWKTPEIMNNIGKDTNTHMTAGETFCIVFEVNGKAPETKLNALINFFEKVLKTTA